MKRQIISAIYLTLSFSLLFAVSELNSFHTKTDNGQTILGKTILEIDSDSVYHQILPVINDEEYIAASCNNCEVEISSVMQMRDLEFSVLTIYPAEDLIAGDSLQIVLEGDYPSEIELR
jgi:hypothetical protein